MRLHQRIPSHWTIPRTSVLALIHPTLQSRRKHHSASTNQPNLSAPPRRLASSALFSLPLLLPLSPLPPSRDLSPAAPRLLVRRNRSDSPDVPTLPYFRVFLPPTTIAPPSSPPANRSRSSYRGGNEAKRKAGLNASSGREQLLRGRKASKLLVLAPRSLLLRCRSKGFMG